MGNNEVSQMIPESNSTGQPFRERLLAHLMFHQNLACNAFDPRQPVEHSCSVSIVQLLIPKKRVAFVGMPTWTVYLVAFGALPTQ
jgi:hypothetical protein